MEMLVTCRDLRDTSERKRLRYPKFLKGLVDLHALDIFPGARPPNGSNTSPKGPST